MAGFAGRFGPLALDRFEFHQQLEAKGANSCKMARQIFGISLRRWLEYLGAILLGNAIYYFSLMPHLPAALRHQSFRVDLGVAVDFAVCAAVYGLIRVAALL